MIEDFPYSHRKWVPKITIDLKDEIRERLLRVTSYNILSDSLLEHTSTKEEIKSNEKNFDWESRKIKILNELKTLNSDVICLQEFDKDEKFIEEVGKSGYDVCFKPRTGGQHSEGCAIFWKYEKFEVENFYCLEMTLRNDSKVYNKDNVCVFAVLKHKKFSNMIFIVANTHVLFNINRGDTKIAQVMQIMNALSKLEEKFKQTHLVSTILTGDFNSIPNSGIYKFITEGNINLTAIDYKKISGQHSGQLNNYDLENNYKDFKKFHYQNLTTKFNENSNHLQLRTSDKKEWIYDILSATLEISNNDCLVLIPADTSKLKIRDDEAKILFNPMKMKSSYSENLRNLINLGLLVSNSKFISENKEFLNIKHLEFLKLIVESTEMNSMNIYGWEFSLSSIENIYTLSQNSTCEPSNTFFAKNLMTHVDYIFYSGSLEVLNTLDTPEIYEMLQMKKLPNEHFPSDHISISAEFLINI